MTFRELSRAAAEARGSALPDRVCLGPRCPGCGGRVWLGAVTRSAARWWCARCPSGHWGTRRGPRGASGTPHEPPDPSGASYHASVEDAILHRERAVGDAFIRHEEALIRHEMMRQVTGGRVAPCLRCGRDTDAAILCLDCRLELLVGEDAP